MKFLISKSLLGIGVLALASTCFAQTATITGRVTDSTESVIPGTQITVTNEATGGVRETEANQTGYYAVPLLPPGQYRIVVEMDGFKQIIRDGITLEVGQISEIDFVMDVGTITEQIEVTADVLQLNTVEASQGQVIENQRIVDMPLNGRNYNQLALLSAGTVQPVGGRFGGFSVGGQRTTQNNFLLDGVDNNGVELAGAQRRSEMVQPSIDAIQEFKVQTNAYAAEFGRAMGAVINLTTKSGTNQLHGTAFHFLRNEAMDAKNFFDPADRPKPKFRRNQYGWSLGGPLYIPKAVDWRNKVFWFGDAEWTDIRETSTITSTIPTAGMRNGDFSDLLTQRNKAITDPLAGESFLGNQIPMSRFDPVGHTMINLYPDPQNADIAANFVNQSPRNEDVKKWDVRADVNITSRDNMYWRYSWHDFVRPAALSLPAPAFGGGNDQLVEGNNTGAGWNHIWSPNLIMSIRGVWNFALFKRDNVAAAKALAEELGVFSLNDAYGIQGPPAATLGSFSLMSVSGYRNVGVGSFNPVDRNSQNRQIVGDLTWTKGKHTVKVGGNLIRSQNNIFNVSRQIGQYSFNARYTRDGQADMLLGLANRYIFSKPLLVDLRQTLYAGYVQDDWKVTSRLTLNLGVRYELVLPWTDIRDRMGNFDITTDPENPVLVPAGSRGTSNFDRAGYKADPNNFMPRLGFAYKIDDNTVLRAGWGLYYTYMEPFGDAQYLIGNPPNAYIVDMNSSATRPAVVLADGPPPGSLELENATGVQFVSYDVDPDLGNAQQWNVNIQRELGEDWMFEVGYSGSVGRHLLRRYGVNFSPPGPGGINEKRRYKSAEITGTGIVTSPLGPIIGYRHDGTSDYHALVTKMEKRFSGGYTLLASYTWSKTMGDTCGGAAQGNTSGCGYQDLRRLELERSVDNQHVPQRLVLSGLWDLPWGKGRSFGSGWSPVLNAIAGGWSVGSIVTAASGRPYSLTVNGNPANSSGATVVNRPNTDGRDPYGGNRTLQEDFDTSAFTPNNQFEIGNLGRNTMFQRGFFNWDFSLLKNIRISEDVGLQFRFESFHFTNTPRFGQAGNVVGTGPFGRITSAGTPRNLQLGMKLVW